MVPNSVPYPDIARDSLTQDKGQDFLTSTCRNYMEDPVGPSHFKFLKGWDKIETHMWFANWKDITIVNSDTTPPQVPQKLSVRCKESLPEDQRGSGLVIDVRTFKIIGCYKCWDLEAPLSHRNVRLPDVEKLKNELRRKSMDIQGMTARTSEAQKKEMSKMREEVRILETRAFDPRPLSIARHEVDGSWHPFFEIDPVMIGHRLGQFAKPCYALQERFEKDLGKEYSVMKDEPQYRYVPGRDDPRYEEHDVIQAA